MNWGNRLSCSIRHPFTNEVRLFDATPFTKLLGVVVYTSRTHGKQRIININEAQPTESYLHSPVDGDFTSTCRCFSRGKS